MMFARTFENVAAGSPDAIAFEKEGSRLSYATLNTTANQIAKRLRDRGVRAGDRVGLYMAADFDLMAAVMAVLKTGAMCVPLDPFDPDERLQFYLKDCEPRCVVTKSPHAHSVPSRWHPYCLDEDRARLLGEPDENLEATPPPESPAFLFYTSGTTGTPKGVVQRHSELVTSYAWFRSYFDVTAGDCGVLKTPCNLVGFRGESLSMLPAGASTVILPVELRYDLKRLVQHLQRGGITLIRLTPSMLRVMLGLPEFTACQRLKHVVCAGEPLSAELEKAVPGRNAGSDFAFVLWGHGGFGRSFPHLQCGTSPVGLQHRQACRYRPCSHSLS
jgi:non-ribosomal peptide synthetase component F